MAKTKKKLDLAKETCDYEIKSLTKLECQHGHRIVQAARPMAELIAAVRKAGYKVQGE